ncbi:GNAT family N-acetyltransferase [Bradyrhizobium cenepequi]|uniref:GNAT family N-acetyltransferase n=1 Tax=Bradyrhizobium cenepequi TaxID=2821403 RepID=UPI001CE27746|nr:GNAT family N-acetyltransferase [Bradyrhizobium cenepequi]MCA6111015.1 GNAT family N-acetyltransferase [Bradyrhizobium cenepequi]
MTVLATSAGKLSARAKARAAGYRVDIFSDWTQAAVRWGTFAPPTAFQNPQWYEAWYAAFADTEGVSPVIALVTDAATGEPAALLPLIRHRHGSLRTIEFADLHLTDYNAPLLGPAAPRDAAAARVFWRDLRAALRKLPGGADLIRFRKVAPDLDGRPNPLALLDTAAVCPVNGNLVTTGEDYDAWRHTLERTTRKELERSWRVFTRDPAAAFGIAPDPDEALRILATTEAQQSSRMQNLGVNFILNDENCAAFYRSLVGNGVASGYAIVSALTAGEEVVATLLGVRNGSRYVMIRISNAGDKWSNCSPGRLIIERTMAALHKQGVREFDFSIGNYAYKRRFGVKRLPLLDISAALSWRGLAHALRDRAAQELRRYPKLTTYLKRALGKPPTREES